MDKLWSSEAKNYLKDLSAFYTFFDPNVNAVQSVVETDPIVPTSQTWTVVGGMNAVSRRLAEQFLAASYRF